MFTKTARNSLAVALTVGGLALAAPAMAAPLGLDAGLHQGSGDIVAVQYGYGHRHGGGHYGFGPRHHRGWGHGHHYGWGRGHHYGWRHHGFGHHHGGWGHHHGHGRW
ncbi:hypothetical protein ACRAWG_05380 [Methylobacterium sp. P31]